MTGLRIQLQSSRNEYRSISYPGDLPSEILPLRIGWRNRFVVGALGAGAVAAAAVVAAVLGRPLMTPDSPGSQPYMPIVKEIHLPQRMQFDLPTLPSVPGIPSNLSLREIAPPLMPSDGLHLPSLNDFHWPQSHDSDDSEPA
jgi:hypothetical protein